MTLNIIDVEQGSEAWHDARRGVLTASTIGRLVTASTIKPASNPQSRSVTLQLVAERITGNTDPTYASAEMERGTWDEPIARKVYNDNIAPVTECGFMTNDSHGVTLGYSPDGLVDGNGLIEIKSRDQKTHLDTILNEKIPIGNMAQLQCGLIVSERAWIDYVSFCSGMPLWTKRVYRDPVWWEAIIAAANAFEATAAMLTGRYNRSVAGLPMTERIPEAIDDLRVP